MEQNATPAPAHHFDIVERARTEAEESLQTLCHCAGQSVTEFAEEARRKWEMYAPPFDEFGRTDKLGRSIVQGLAKTFPTHQFDLTERSLAETAAANAALADSLFRSRDRVFETSQPMRDFLAYAHEMRKITEELKTYFTVTLPGLSTWDRFLKMGLTMDPLVQSGMMIESGDEFARRCHEVFAQLSVPAKPKPQIIERERQFIWVFGLKNEADSVESPETGLVGVFTRHGRYWRMGIDGKIERVSHSKGFEYIAFALASPEVPLVHREVFDAVACMDISEITSPDKYKLAPKAMSEIRAERIGLKVKLAKAEECGLIERAEKLRVEIEELEDNLSADIGLGGRSRVFPERNRKAKDSVNRAIKRALDRLAEDHPALYNHLTDSLELTPLLCYQPSHPVDWEM